MKMAFLKTFEYKKADFTQNMIDKVAYKINEGI